MASNNYLGNKDTQFNSNQNTIYAMAFANSIPWMIPAGALTALDAYKIAWDAAWAIAMNHSFRTHADVLVKIQARKAYEPALRQFVKTYLRNNPNVPTSSLAAMGINTTNPHIKPAPIPIVTSYPVVTLKPNGTNNFISKYQDSVHVGNLSGRPTNPVTKNSAAVGMVTVYTVAPIGSIIGQSQCTSFAYQTRINKAFVPVGGVSGQAVFAYSWWIMPDGRTGPVSPQYSVTIP